MKATVITDKKTSQTVVSSSRGTLVVNWITDAICRVRFAEDGRFSSSALIRYGFIKNDWPAVDFKVNEEADAITIAGKSLKIQVAGDSLKVKFIGKQGAPLLEGADSPEGNQRKNFKACFALPEKTAFFGLGDQTRERIEHRGTKASLWIENVVRYIPVPFLMADSGFALLANTTRRIEFDLGATDPERFWFEGRQASLDYYFFKGDSPAHLIELYTSLTGRPPLPPKWSFGLWFCCHESINDRELLADCHNFRREDFPCDNISLEAGWMEKLYDFSVDKKWSQQRFCMPEWRKKGRNSFIEAARNLGFKLGLWLCMDYDLSYEEERRLKEGGRNMIQSEYDGHLDQAEIKDPHFAKGIHMDKITKPGVPWFDHLKAFIDEGVEYFKLDGCAQVHQHADRLYSNGMHDDEMHNLYPLLYSKQMALGFREHTGRRSAFITPCGWAGFQRFPGTWTGDTGGGPKTLAACLNLSLTGHGYSTCDMDVSSPGPMHFGFLMPWSQINSFCCFRQPWLLSEQGQKIFRDYAKLRYRLLPYLYSMAFKACQSGLPIMRALPLMFPKDLKCRQILNEYMLGDFFLVSAFDKKTYLPEGRWIDYWIGKVYEGPQEFDYIPPEDRGGGLFVRAGAIIPMGPEVAYVGQKPDAELVLDIYPFGESEFVLYEDDGSSYDYEKGVCAMTEISAARQSENITVNIGARKGSYTGMPANRSYMLKLHLDKAPGKVSLNGKPLKKTSDRKAMAPAKGLWRYDRDQQALWINSGVESGVIVIS